MTSAQQPEKDPNRRKSDQPFATAAYIAEICTDLGRMAREDGLDTLAYILDMARLEAQSLANQSKPASK
jgi:hypothetical protein